MDVLRGGLWQKENLDFNSGPEDQAQNDRLAGCIDKRLASKVTCVLKAVPSKSVPGCKAAVGYSAGAQSATIGETESSSNSRPLASAIRATCPRSEPSLHPIA